MGKIKPTRVITPRIVESGEGGGRWWMWLLFLIALGMWTWQVFEFGRQHSQGYQALGGIRSQDVLHQRIKELEAERDALKAAAERFEQAGQQEKVAAEDVKSEVKTLQSERAELKREVAFLNSLVGGEESRLVLDDFRLIALDGRGYRIEVTLSKRTDNQDPVNGQISFSMIGDLDGNGRILGMRELTDGRRTNVGIKFKSFQKVTADIELPEGFEPATVVVAFKPADETFKAFEQTYDWIEPGA